MDKLKNTRILGAVGLGIMFIATFLPYAVASVLGFSSSVSLFGYWEGKITLLVCFANALFVFKDYINKYVPQLFEKGIGKSIRDAKPIFSLIPTGISVLLNIVLILQISGYEYIHFGVGFYVMWVGILCMIAHAILYKEPAATEATPTAPEQPAAPTPSAGVAPTPVAEPTSMETTTATPVVEPTTTEVAAPAEPQIQEQPVTPVQEAPAMPAEQPVNPMESAPASPEQPAPMGEATAPGFEAPAQPTDQNNDQSTGM